MYGIIAGIAINGIVFVTSQIFRVVASRRKSCFNETTRIEAWPLQDVWVYHGEHFFRAFD